MPNALKNRAVQILLGAIVALAVIAGAILLLRPSGGAADVSASPSATTTAPASNTAAPTCTNFTGAMESPTKFVVERMHVESPMVVVGEDADGNPGTPPLDQGQTTAWYHGSPAPGTTQGNVILTIHTFHFAQALGNQLYGKNVLADGEPGLQVGDLIKISDDQGNQVCYRYTGNTKVWVDSYDPDSDVFHNLEGPPQLAIMICWDYVPATKDWDSRIIFYAALIPEGTPA